MKIKKWLIRWSCAICLCAEGSGAAVLDYLEKVQSEMNQSEDPSAGLALKSEMTSFLEDISFDGTREIALKGAGLPTLSKETIVKDLSEFVGDSSAWYTLHSLKTHAQIARARMGDMDAFDSIFEQIYSKNPSVRHAGYRGLAMMKTDMAINKLGEILLGEIETESHGGDYGDVIALSSKAMAVDALSLAINQKPFKDGELTANANYIERWQDWWHKNKWKYQVDEHEETTGVSLTAVKSIVPQSIVKEPTEVDTPKPSEEPAEQSSNWWLWLIGAVVVVGGIGLVARRKS